jgi:hypothetical protein
MGISYGQEISIPEEVDGVYLGMPVEELLTKRPALRQRLLSDPEWMAGKRGEVLIENLPSNPRFDSVLFVFSDKRLVGLMFYMVSEDSKQILARRKLIYNHCATRFGKTHKREVGTLEGKSKRPKRVAALSWEKSNGGAYLFMPQSSAAKSPKAILMLVSTTAKQKVLDSFEKEDITDAEKKEIFKSVGAGND